MRDSCLTFSFIFRFCRSVPVSRAQDDAKAGSGEIIISEDNLLVVKGFNTKFLSELGPKMQIMLPKSAGAALATVVEVSSDTELRIKKEFAAEGSKSSSKIKEQIKEAKKNGRHGLSYKVLPFVDQRDMYAHVFQCLKEGGCIGIFPEGMFMSTSFIILKQYFSRWQSRSY